MPSGFLRDATSLRHPPKSKTVAAFVYGGERSGGRFSGNVCVRSENRWHSPDCEAWLGTRDLEARKERALTGVRAREVSSRSNQSWVASFRPEDWPAAETAVSFSD